MKFYINVILSSDFPHNNPRFLKYIKQNNIELIETPPSIAFSKSYIVEINALEMLLEMVKAINEHVVIGYEKMNDEDEPKFYLEIYDYYRE